MSGQFPIDQNQNATLAAMPWSPARLWAWRAALVLFLAYLLLRAFQIRNAAFEPVHWAFNNEGQVVAWFGSLVWHEVVMFALSFLLGLLVPPAIGPTLVNEDQQRRWLKWAAFCGFGLLTIFLCFLIARCEAPPLGSIILPFVAYLLGLYLSSAAMRGIRPAAFAIGLLALLFVLFVGAMVGVAYLAVSPTPLKFDAPELSTDDKRALAQRIRDTHPPEGEPRRVHLADAEINALVNSILSRGAIQHRGSVHFEPEKIAAQASFALPPQIAQDKFLNVQLTGQASIDKGHLKLALQSLRLGSVDVPRPFVTMLSSFMFALLEDDPELRRITDSVDKMATEEGAINFVFESDSISRQIVPSLVQLLWKQPDVAAETRLYLQNLLFVYRTLPPDADRFGWLVHAAFAMAAERSQDHDPLLENRAALLALAILMGHQDLEIFVGEVLDPDGRAQVGRIMNTVELRGRHDLARHFLVSAALTVLSHESISDRIGVLKEELDSQDGGSGFSFVDLLADFAGTRFASIATQNESTARALQTNLLQKFDVDAYFPPFDGLPEDIPAAELQSKYGGVGGVDYQKIIEEINRRLAALPKL